MMLDLGEYQEESVNIIAIMGPHGVYHKDEPIKELEAALQRQGFQTIWPQNSADLLQFIEHNPRICGVIFDWDEYSVDLCSDINQLNEYAAVQHLFGDFAGRLRVHSVEKRG